MERALLEKESLKKDMAETEGARRASGVSATGADAVPDPEVVEKPKRRRFSAQDKLRVLRLADACTKPGEVGALVRREGLYSSHLTEWRRARAAGELDALTPKQRGRKALANNPLEKRVLELERALAKSELRTKRAEALVELQKKVSELLGIQLPKEDETR